MPIKENCLSCKFITVCCMLGVGGYLINVGRKMDAKSRLALGVLGTAVAGLGVGEIFDVSPFREKHV